MRKDSWIKCIDKRSTTWKRVVVAASLFEGRERDHRKRERERKLFLPTRIFLHWFIRDLFGREILISSERFSSLNNSAQPRVQDFAIYTRDHLRGSKLAVLRMRVKALSAERMPPPGDQINRDHPLKYFWTIRYATPDIIITSLDTTFRLVGVERSF